MVHTGIKLFQLLFVVFSVFQGVLVHTAEVDHPVGLVTPSVIDLVVEQHERPLDGTFSENPEQHNQREKPANETWAQWAARQAALAREAVASAAVVLAQHVRPLAYAQEGAGIQPVTKPAEMVEQPKPSAANVAALQADLGVDVSQPVLNPHALTPVESQTLGSISKQLAIAKPVIVSDNAFEALDLEPLQNALQTVQAQLAPLHAALQDSTVMQNVRDIITKTLKAFEQSYTQTKSEQVVAAKTWVDGKFKELITTYSASEAELLAFKESLDAFYEQREKLLQAHIGEFLKDDEVQQTDPVTILLSVDDAFNAANQSLLQADYDQLRVLLLQEQAMVQNPADFSHDQVQAVVKQLNSLVTSMGRKINKQIVSMDHETALKCSQYMHTVQDAVNDMAAQLKECAFQPAVKQSWLSTWWQKTQNAWTSFSAYITGQKMFVADQSLYLTEAHNYEQIAQSVLTEFNDLQQELTTTNQLLGQEQVSEKQIEIAQAALQTKWNTFLEKWNALQSLRTLYGDASGAQLEKAFGSLNLNTTTDSILFKIDTAFDVTAALSKPEVAIQEAKVQKIDKSVFDQAKVRLLDSNGFFQMSDAFKKLNAPARSTLINWLDDLRFEDVQDLDEADKEAQEAALLFIATWRAAIKEKTDQTLIALKQVGMQAFTSENQALLQAVARANNIPQIVEILQHKQTAACLVGLLQGDTTPISQLMNQYDQFYVKLQQEYTRTGAELEARMSQLKSGS